jgi:hypothetical protein
MLSLAKHCFVNSLFFESFFLVLVFPPFALMQKVEPKNQAAPNRSARFATHAQQHPTLFCSILVITRIGYVFSQTQLFKNLML